MKHTPTPWKFHSNGNVFYGVDSCDTSDPQYGTQQHNLCQTYGLNAKPNAQFIVRACNSHEELVEALQGIVMALDRGLNPITDRAKQALANATK